MVGGEHGRASRARRVVTIANSLGLHARAAARFVKLAGRFDATITVARGADVVSGRSIMGLMALGAGSGTEIELRASGPESLRAVEALARLVERNFDEA
ncbi:MAG: HPr family phosphocarrier protein [Alphaproteobacteria bacterium]